MVIFHQEPKSKITKYYFFAFSSKLMLTFRGIYHNGIIMAKAKSERDKISTKEPMNNEILDS